MNNNEFARFKDLGKVDINNIDDFIRKHKIAEGNTDLYVGDFFTAVYDDREIKFRIYGINSDKGCKKNHIVVVPDGNLENSEMRSVLCSDTGFINTTVFKKTTKKVDRKLKKIFGKHLLTTKVMLSDSSDTVKEYEVKSISMSEVEVFGEPIYSKGLSANKEEQLPLFKLITTDFVTNMLVWFWLRDEHKDSATLFCLCGDYTGYLYCGNASAVGGVRNRFLLG